MLGGRWETIGKTLSTQAAARTVQYKGIIVAFTLDPTKPRGYSCGVELIVPRLGSSPRRIAVSRAPFRRPESSMSGFAPNLPLPAPARHRLAHRLALPVGRTHACQHGVLLSREAECAMGCGSAPA